MRYKQFELAISRYTFVDNEMQAPSTERGLTALTFEQLQEQIETYQLCFIQPVLFMKKAVAIGSRNIVSPILSEMANMRSYYAMVICRIDGERPTLQHVQALQGALKLEPRERFMSPDPDGGPSSDLTPSRSDAA
jgi:hypothetical protein